MIKKLKQWIADALGFSKTEANGTLILILLILIVVIIPKIYLLKSFSAKESFPDESEKLKSWASALESTLVEVEPKTSDQVNQPSNIPESFHFDPNTATSEALLSLGFSRKTTDNLIRYREAGGTFRTKSDLEKIYGINKKRLEALHDFIDLPAEALPKKETQPPKTGDKKPVYKKPSEKFDLNIVEAKRLQDIRGIGPVLSDRIISFRDKLGGFHSADQLYEVYGLDSTVIARLLERAAIDQEIRPLYINTDSVHYLYHHPYIDYRTANVILNYRKQHGDFDSISQIKRIKIISDSLYEKIYPYLSIDP